MNRKAMIAGISILAAASGVASGGELPGQGATVMNGEEAAIISPAADLTGLPPRATSSPCANPSRQPSGYLPYIYRYCAYRQDGYEAQRDDWYRTTRDRYTGSWQLDCDNDAEWKPLSMKNYFCP
jgi:hypothetical protein